jgi:hypothetical protein
MTAVQGHAPAVAVQPTEKAKYEQIWAHDQYRSVSPGEHSALLFKKIVNPEKGQTCIDFGCGTGRGGSALAVFCKLNVTLMDFAGNCLDQDTRELIEEFPDKLKFVEHDLTKPSDLRAMYGYCTDVMEHIPPHEVDQVLDTILSSAKKVFFQISCEDDQLGVLIGQPLHLSVHNHEWWRKKLEDQGCIIRWEQDCTSHCCFYVSRFASVTDLVPRGAVNTDTDEMQRNIVANLAAGYREVTPHDTNDIEVMLLAGGPSLEDYADEIIKRRAEGMPLITVNGAYHWAIGHGMKPSAQIIGDCREWNRRFVIPAVDGCRYLLNAACHPSVIKAAPSEQVLLWLAGDGDHVKEALKGFTGDHFPVHGGSTTMLRAIPLMRMLGYRKFHIYGWDSCLREEQHHAYAQPENDDPRITTVTVKGREFRCHPWMAVQAQEFVTITRMIADECELEVYGDGLISWIIKANAEEI